MNAIRCILEPFGAKLELGMNRHMNGAKGMDEIEDQMSLGLKNEGRVKNWKPSLHS